ncbi:hypothetical protein FUMI01_04240 [Flavobacterium sp. UMI-01]|nr:hypothetical protein FUMI01_04240 [Flavobacterium sp. UMI-01]
MENKGIHAIIAIGIVLSSVFLFTFLLIYLLFLQMDAFSKEWDQFKLKILETFDQLSLYLTDYLGISIEQQLSFLKNIFSNPSNQLFSFLQSIVTSLSEAFFYILIIPILSGLILYHRRLLVQALFHLFPSHKKTTLNEILIATIHSYYNFAKGMALVYLSVGILNSLGLFLLGIPHPIMFGFIASILTFIPYVGILISSLVPIALSWLTYNSIWYPIGVILLFTFVQLLEAYVIFPFAVGSRLKINTLVIIVMITLGGILWGAAGMILFIPFVSILKLIADRTKSLKTLSILLSDGSEQQ